MGGLQRSRDIEFVQVRHEEMAAFMACAHAKFTGEIGVCIATGGPGASHLITGLYDAKLDHVPVLAVTGQAPRASRGAHYQQEVDLERMFSDVAEYVQEGRTVAQIPHLIDRGIRIARARHGVAVVVLPNDLQELPYKEPPRKHGTVHSGVGYQRPRVIPRDADLRRAADILNAGSKVAILVGAGALHAGPQVVRIADALGAGVAKALLGKGVVPDHLPWVTGSIGLLGTEPSADKMSECDTLLMIGSGFPYAEFLPKPDRARGVQIDIDPGMLSIRFPAEVNLVGDAAETLDALAPLLRRKTERAWRERIEGKVAKWWKLMEERAQLPADPINPQRVVTELSLRLPERAIVTSDSGSCANWYARDLRIREGQLCSLSGGLASMGAAVPYAIAAKFAFPDRPVIALVGDGAMQMNNMAELITVAKYWRQWGHPCLLVCVFNNEDLNQVTWEQRVMEGDPKFDASQKLPNVPYHQFARLIGLEGIYCDDSGAIGPSWERALEASRPVLLEFKTDPEVPPLPAHITLEQANHFVKALLKGDSHEERAISGTFRQLFASLSGLHRAKTKHE